MADKIVTTLEQYLVGGSGTRRIADTTDRDNLKILAICPESATVMTTLTVVGPDGVEKNALDTIANGGRNLGSMVAGVTYTAGVNSYFKRIKLTSGAVAVQYV